MLRSWLGVLYLFPFEGPRHSNGMYVVWMQESLKKCQRCMEVIIDAKERQAAEANKNATILLQEIDQEKVPSLSSF